MQFVVHAILLTVFVWWFTTGVIIYLDGLPQRTFKVSMAAMTVLLAVALYGVATTRDDTTVAGAYTAFACAITAWGWNEMGFLMGLITGSRTTPCPEGATGLARLNAAIQAVMYHEVAIGLTAGAIAIASNDGANHVALWTFGVLWVMRLSAKINVYLGVPNVTEEFLPPHLTYLKSYFRTRSMNAAFPVCVTLATLLTAHLAGLARADAATPFEVTAYTLLATLSALAVIEHWFMVVPFQSTALWQWGLVSHAAHTVPVPGPGPGVLRVAPPDADLVDAGGSTLTGTSHHPIIACCSGEHANAIIVPFPTPVPHRRRP